MVCGVVVVVLGGGVAGQRCREQSMSRLKHVGNHGERVHFCFSVGCDDMNERGFADGGS